MTSPTAQPAWALRPTPQPHFTESVRPVCFVIPGLLFALSPCFAQWEIGGFYGYGWYNSGTIFSSAELLAPAFSTGSPLERIWTITAGTTYRANFVTCTRMGTLT